MGRGSPQPSGPGVCILHYPQNPRWLPRRVPLWGSDMPSKHDKYAISKAVRVEDRRVIPNRVRRGMNPRAIRSLIPPRSTYQPAGGCSQKHAREVQKDRRPLLPRVPQPKRRDSRRDLFIEIHLGGGCSTGSVETRARHLYGPDGHSQCLPKHTGAPE